MLNKLIYYETNFDFESLCIKNGVQKKNPAFYKTILL